MLNKKICNKTINHYCGIDIDVSKIYKLNKFDINIYQGPFYLNFFMSYIWLILPTTLYHEDYLTYINLEGRYRVTQKAISPSNNIENDSVIFNLLFKLKNKLVNSNFSIINNFYLYFNYFNKVIKFINLKLNNFYIKYFISVDNLNIDFMILNFSKLLFIFSFKLLNNILIKTIYNSYFVDPITKNSKILNKINTNLILFIDKKIKF